MLFYFFSPKYKFTFNFKMENFGKQVFNIWKFTLPKTSGFGTTFKVPLYFILIPQKTHF